MAAAARWCSKPGRGGSEPAPEVRGEADGHGGQRSQPCEARLHDRFDPDVVRWPASEDVGPVEHLGRKCPRAVDADAQQRLALRQRQQPLPIGEPPGDGVAGRVHELRGVQVGDAPGDARHRHDDDGYGDEDGGQQARGDAAERDDESEDEADPRAASPRGDELHASESHDREHRVAGRPSEHRQQHEAEGDDERQVGREGVRMKERTPDAPGERRLDRHLDPHEHLPEADCEGRDGGGEHGDHEDAGPVGTAREELLEHDEHHHAADDLGHGDDGDGSVPCQRCTDRGDRSEGDQRSRRHRGPVPRARSMLHEHPGKRKADEEQHDCSGGVDWEAGRPDARTSGGLGFGERVEQRSPGEQRHRRTTRSATWRARRGARSTPSQHRIRTPRSPIRSPETRPATRQIRSRAAPIATTTTRKWERNRA